MKRLFLLFNLVVLLVLSSSTDAQDFVPGEIMIDIKHEYLPISLVPNAQGIIETGLPSIDSLNALFGVCDFEMSVNTSSELNKGVLLFKFLDSLNVDDVLSSYLTDPHVSVASPNYIPHPDVIPDDHFFPQQWGLSKMKCPEAWRHTNGSSSIIIQIIDGGTSYGHPDLVHNIWQNLGEDADGDGHTIEWDPAQNRWVLDPGDVELPNGVDNDRNGYCDDLVGFDFRDDPCNDGYGYGFDPQPTRDPPFVWEDHGDKTAGTAAAVTNNWITEDEAERVCYLMTETAAGASWFSKIMIARMYDDWDARDAIDYAIDRGANIINMSWSQSGDNPLLHSKVDEAWAAGILLVASAGGQSDSVRRYPAAYPSVIAVAGTESNDVKATGSNWGSWVDICAPYGNAVPGRDPTYFGYYCYDTTFSGTSASAPFVAGVAALVWTCNLSATNAEVRAALEDSADNIDHLNPGYEDLLGSGRVNALRAVRAFRPLPPPPGDANTDWTINVGDVVYLVSYIYKGGPPPDPLCVGDVNDDGIVDVADVVYLVNYLYSGGPAPLDGCD